MYRDVTHSYRGFHHQRVEEISDLHRAGGSGFRLRDSLGTWLITLGQRLLAGRAMGSAAVGTEA